jgi:hypothetical protein
MHIHTPQKSGVLGVAGVRSSLKASNGGPYSDGTQTYKSLNTWCSEHLSCSENLPIGRISAHPFPAGRSAFVAQRGTQAQPIALGEAGFRGMGKA